MAGGLEGMLGSNDMGKSVKKEPGQRCWMAKEDDMLLKALKELVVKGEKTDNGFKAGYQNKLEAAMKKIFHHANIKANPHINSKLTSWEKTYGILVTILSHSGVGFNLHGNHKVDCDAEQWEEILKIDKDAEKVMGRSWPMFDGWKEVFGKDRATGEGAEDVMEMVNKMNDEHGVEDVPLNNSDTIDLESNKQTEAADDSACQSALRDSNTKQSKNKKRKSQDHIQNLTDMLSEMHDDTNARLQSLVNRIGYQIDLCKAKKEVLILLQKVPDLSLDN